MLLIENCAEMTKMLGIPGLKVINPPIEGESDYYSCIFDPDVPPKCQKTDCNGVGNRAEIPPTQHIIYDIIDDDPHKIVKLNVRARRHRCAVCGDEIPVEASSDILAAGVKSTKRLDTWITAKCLDNSPKIVSGMIGKVLSPSTCKDIFVRTTDRDIAAFSDRLLAPNVAGIQFHPFGNLGLIVVTDIEHKYVLDVFQNGDARINCLLNRLVRSRTTSKCVSDVLPNCLIPARGTIGYIKDAVVVVSHSSLYREISKAYVSFISQYYIGPKKSLVRQFFSRNLGETISGFDQRNIRNLFSDCIYSIIPSLNSTLASFLFIRETFNHWNMTNFDRWINDISSNAYFDNLLDLVSDARQEISRSGNRLTLQKPYDEIVNKVNLALEKCKKCSVDTARRRILLKCNPATTMVTGKDGVLVTRFYGIPIEDLLDKLQPYNA